MQHRVNKDLILRTRDWIHQPTVLWDQSSWTGFVDLEDSTECGTAYCYAGWAVALAGFFITPENEYVPLSFVERITGLDPARVLEAAQIKRPRGEIIAPEIHVQDAATVILGLDNLMLTQVTRCKCGEVECEERPTLVKAANALFRGQNSLEDINRVIAEIFATVGIEE